MQSAARANFHSPVARKGKPPIDQVADMAHQAVDRAIGAVTPSADWLTGQGENLNATRRRLVRTTSTYVSDNPFKSVGIAVLAGFLLSRLIR